MVQLAGGNDGLNALAPYGDDEYYKVRPTIAIPREKVHKLDDHVGLHPEMVELKAIFDDGGLGVVQNVGYPNPNRSHFRATDIWETGSPAGMIWKDGWMGRYFDNECRGTPEGTTLGLCLGERPPLTFAGSEGRCVTMVNPSMLEAPTEGVKGQALERLSRVEPTGIDALDFVQRTANQSRALSRRIEQAVRDVKPSVEYLPFILCQSLRLISQMIAADIPTRVYYVSLGGFDTHSSQVNRHAALLQELSQALGTFYRDLKSNGHLDRVLVMTFSEFGRRIGENKQAGTDHGTANVMFLMGGAVQPGLHGRHVDLKHQDEQGDLVHQTDFRSVYASVLRDWFRADPRPVLKGDFDSLTLVRSQANKT